MRHATLLICVCLIFVVLVTNVAGAQFVFILSKDDLKELPEDADNELADSLPEWDDFGDSDEKANREQDSGSWRLIFEADNETLASDSEFYSSLRKLLSASTEGEAMKMEEAITELDSLSSAGHPHAQSVLGFLHGYGIMKEKDKAKSLLYHHFAAQGGNLQSKMVLAYTYSRQDMQEEAVKLYAELAEVAVNSFLHPKVSPVIEPVRIHVKSEENKEALKKSRGEDDEDFKILEYQAQRGNAAAMYKMGLFYYYGLRGLRRDNVKALKWFTKAAEKDEPRSMEHLGEMYARGAGVERNYTTSYHYLKRASRQLSSAYNGMGYLYVKGYGVENQNFTKAKEFFEKAAEKDDSGARYNLGVMYLKGVGVKRDLKSAFANFIFAANMAQPKAFYQLAKMFHKGIGLKKDIPMACSLYKLVAERGPSSSLSRYALESYVKGDVGKALFLYSRMAELGSEVAQSNAAWILEKYGDRSVCVGESGPCTDADRHDRTHLLWWQASEQGNEHAALLIGDAYYYGRVRGTGRDFERAAEAYQHAKSQSSAQAMFNLGYMHEHGEGLPYDLHLAKRYYDEALANDDESYLAVKLALGVVWLRMNYGDGIAVRLVDALPEAYPKVIKWVEQVVLEEGNATILTLFVCLLTVLYFRERQRRNAAAAAAAAGDFVVPHRFNGNDNAAVFH